MSVPRVLLAVLLVVCLSCSTDSATESEAAPECGTVPAGFTEHTAELSGAQVHYVIGGQGPAVVLLHGFPETWWTWREVMPRLAERHTVIAPDLPGVGCSSVGAEGYGSATMARDVHDLVTSLGIDRVALVGHDTGGWVAYAYARQFREEVSHLVLSGAAIPGFGLERLLDFRKPGQGLPHLPFFLQPEVPETLIGGRENEYFGDFINSAAMHDSGAVDFYARSYARPGRLTAALAQYRALYTSAEANRRGAGPILVMPTLALSGTGQTAITVDGLRQVAQNVGEVGIPGGGHYIQEERPAEVADALEAFFATPPPA
jgi:pimeloyl-ACP methyl ester carboxylesterase